VIDQLALEFRSAMRRLTTTVNIVTTVDEGQRFGITATAVTSVCAEPATILVCINRSASIFGGLGNSGRFCINMLRVGQEDVSAAFSGGAKGDDRFCVGEWRSNSLIDGLPYLATAQASLFCRTASAMSYGTHQIFIGTVLAVHLAEEIAPLLFQDGKYARSTYL
jgi:flavin reductase